MLHVTHSRAHESKEAAIERLDSEIHKLTEQLWALKAQRNSYSPSYTLPSEVLSKIFIIVQETCGGWRTERFKFQAWLPITQVSQHWRRVALEASQLWCEFHDIPKLAVSAFLARSKERNLSVEISCNLATTLTGYIYEQAHLAEIFSQSYRIEKLSIGREADFSDIFPYLTLSPSPILKELSIESCNAYIPDDVFQGSTPQLRSLSLSGCQFNMNSPLLMNDLTKLYVDQYVKTPLHAWLNPLQHMPRLSSLRLISCSQLEDGIASEESTGHIAASKDIGIVPLLQLCELDILEFSFEESIGFLAHITFPSTTLLSLSAASPTTELAIPSLVTFLQVHSKSRQHISAMEINSIRLENNFQDKSYMHLIVSMDRTYPSPLDVRIWEHGFDIIDVTHLVALPSLPLSSVTSFTTNFWLDLDGWKVLSDIFPNLEEISISNIAVRSFLSSFGACEVEDTGNANVNMGHVEGGSSTTASGEGDLLFPSLRAIIFRNTYLNLHDLQDQILSILQTRRDCGFPIKTVKLWRCTAGSTDFVSRLEGLVDVDVSDGWKVYQRDTQANNDILMENQGLESQCQPVMYGYFNSFLS